MTVSVAVDVDVNPFVAFSVNLSEAARPLQESGVAIVNLYVPALTGTISTCARPGIPLNLNCIDVCGVEETISSPPKNAAACSVDAI